MATTRASWATWTIAQIAWTLCASFTPVARRDAGVECSTFRLLSCASRASAGAWGWQLLCDWLCCGTRSTRCGGSCTAQTWHANAAAGCVLHATSTYSAQWHGNTPLRDCRDVGQRVPFNDDGQQQQNVQEAAPCTTNYSKTVTYPAGTTKRQQPVPLSGCMRQLQYYSKAQRLRPGITKSFCCPVH